LHVDHIYSLVFVVEIYVGTTYLSVS